MREEKVKLCLFADDMTLYMYTKSRSWIYHLSGW